MFSKPDVQTALFNKNHAGKAKSKRFSRHNYNFTIMEISYFFCNFVFNVKFLGADMCPGFGIDQKGLWQPGNVLYPHPAGPQSYY